MSLGSVVRGLAARASADDLRALPDAALVRRFAATRSPRPSNLSHTESHRS